MPLSPTLRFDQGCVPAQSIQAAMSFASRADHPLVHRIIRDAVDADLAVRPGLRARPFDTSREVLRLASRPRVEKAGRAAGSARVDPHTCVAVRHPALGIDQLPVLVFVGRTLLDVGVGLHDSHPGMFVVLLEAPAFGVGTVAQNRGIFSLRDRAKHVGAQHDAVVHCDRGVPLDRHAVAGFSSMLAHARGLAHRLAHARKRRRPAQAGLRHKCRSTATSVRNAARGVG